MSTTTAAINPLLVPSDLPHGFPRFDRIRPEHYAPAFQTAMQQHLAEIEAIAENPAPPTFENTLVALEKSGQLFNSIEGIFANMTTCNTNDELRAIEAEMAPKLSEHADAVLLNAKLFQRIRALYDQRDSLALDPESNRLLWQYHLDLERAGARLEGAQKERLKVLNNELAVLQTEFAQTLMKEVAASGAWFDSVEELDGLSAEDIAGAQTAANEFEASKRGGAFLIKLTNTSGQPVLDKLTVPASRAKVMQCSLARGSRGGEFDARHHVVQISGKRAERAALLGYKNHSEFQLADQTIGGSAQANKLLKDLAPAAVANARKEHAVLQSFSKDKGHTIQVTAADWDFYAEQVRSRDFNFDESTLKPYFDLNRVFEDGVLFAATRLYGLKFVPRTDLPVYEKTVKVYNVFEEDGTTLVALLVVDFYARESKRGGAWMNEYVRQSKLLNAVPIIGNHLNVPPPAAGSTTALLTFDEVRTLFHEFGHGLHGMLSNVVYPRLSGTSVPTDFVEFPSQVNEMWATFPEVMSNYAKHHETGAPLDPELITKMNATLTFNEGYRTTEYLAACLLDQAYHQLTESLPGPEAVIPFEEKALADAGLDFAAVPPRYRSTYFAHIFSSNGYAAKYCGYLWSEVLDAHAADWITKNGGLTRENGERLRRTVLSRGGSADPLGLFYEMVGEPAVNIQPLLRRRGLTVAAQ